MAVVQDHNLREGTTLMTSCLFVKSVITQEEFLLQVEFPHRHNAGSTTMLFVTKGDLIVRMAVKHNS